MDDAGIVYEPVTSSNVGAVGYDAAARRLWVQFLNGSVYSYEGVPPELHRGLLSAPSVGSYLATEVKGRYPFKRVR